MRKLNQADRWREYEQKKKYLQDLKLPPAEYEARLLKLLKKLRV